MAKKKQQIAANPTSAELSMLQVLWFTSLRLLVGRIKGDAAQSCFYESHEQAVRAANDYIERFYIPNDCTQRSVTSVRTSLNSACC